MFSSKDGSKELSFGTTSSNDGLSLGAIRDCGAVQEYGVAGGEELGSALG